VSVCVLDDCAREAGLPGTARGLCHAHYRRWQRYGDPKGVPSPRPSLVERLWPKFQRNASGCWLWTATLNNKGYGMIGVGGQMRLAHRAAYELLVGPIPEGLDLDHLCHNADESCAGGTPCGHRRCINPAHLEPATRSVNARRGRAYSPEVMARRAPTHCPHGHAYDEANTLVSRQGWRRCRTCKLDQQRQRRAA